MEKIKFNIRFGTVFLIILMTTFSRLIPHPVNFAPIGAISLFGAAYFSRKSLALLVPVLSMWLSDLVINNIVYSQYFDGFVWFYQGFYWTYLSFPLIGVVGLVLLKRVKTHTVFVGSLIASMVFYLVSNFGVWVSGTMYTKDFSGLITCYIAAIPFFKNTVLGDFVYCAVLFGGYEFVRSKIPVLRFQSVLE
ncbi:MAG: hypothetical protein PHF61_00380 [Bacteroidales bacterium]|nr:hypothetical protein [Bacteroidales bacterium]